MGDKSELRGDDGLIAAVLQSAPYEFLVDVGTVDLGGVDERDTELECPVNGADRLGVIAASTGVAV
jgi:hypothetical protein